MSLREGGRDRTHQYPVVISEDGRKVTIGYARDKQDAEYERYRYYDVMCLDRLACRHPNHVRDRQEFVELTIYEVWEGFPHMMTVEIRNPAGEKLVDGGEKNLPRYVTMKHDEEDGLLIFRFYRGRG